MTAVQLASSVIQNMKYGLVCPRPAQYSPFVQPMIQTPEFFAFPSGHCTQSFMVARLLQTLSGQKPHSILDQLLQQQAEFIATNRVIAGVHFPVDGVCGRMMGEALASYFKHRSYGGGWRELTFDGRTQKIASQGNPGDALLYVDLDLNEVVEQDTQNDPPPSARCYERNTCQRSRSDAEGGVSHLTAKSRSQSETPLGWLWRKAQSEWL